MEARIRVTAKGSVVEVDDLALPHPDLVRERGPRVAGHDTTAWQTGLASDRMGA